MRRPPYRRTAPPGRPILAAALLAAFMAVPAAARDHKLIPKVELLRPPTPVRISTVSAPAKERINEQSSPNAPYSVTDASLEKSAIGAGYTLMLLPAFTYNRNEGSWAGGLAPFFRANSKGQIEDIFAPLYLHNEFIGETFTFNYYGYRSETRQYHVILSLATEVEHTVDVSYKDTGVQDGRYILSLQASSEKSAFNRFFGFGNKVSEQMESDYAMTDTNLKANGGINLGHSLAVIATERFRQVSIENGVISDLPQTLQAFPNAPGIDGARVWGQGLTFSYDTRDNQLTSLKGTYATLTTESNQNYEPNNRDSWWHVTAEARHFLPHADERAVFVSHALINLLPIDSKGLVRQGVPFYERPTLGGENSLRGFGRGRFVSSVAVLFNIEERLSLVQKSIMGSVLELEVAPFLDFGRVARSFGSQRVVRDIQFNPGVGIRMLARPNIATRLDVAYGRDGTNVFVGLDYPF